MSLFVPNCEAYMCILIGNRGLSLASFWLDTTLCTQLSSLHDPVRENSLRWFEPATSWLRDANRNRYATIYPRSKPTVDGDVCISFIKRSESPRGYQRATQLPILKISWNITLFLLSLRNSDYPIEQPSRCQRRHTTSVIRPRPAV